MAQTKKCRRCGNDLALSNFGIDNSREDGLNQWCRECVRAQALHNRLNRKGSIDFAGIIKRITVLTDAVLVKSPDNYMDVPGTIRALIEALDLDYGIMWPILKGYLAKAGRNKYRVIAPVNPGSIQSKYLMALMEQKKSAQITIEFGGKMPFSRKQLFIIEYQHRTGMIERQILQTINTNSI